MCCLNIYELSHIFMMIVWHMARTGCPNLKNMGYKNWNFKLAVKPACFEKKTEIPKHAGFTAILKFWFFSNIWCTSGAHTPIFWEGVFYIILCILYAYHHFWKPRIYFESFWSLRKRQIFKGSKLLVKPHFWKFHCGKVF